MKRLIWPAIAFLLGLLLGAALLKNSQPRSFAALGNCGGSCYKPNDLAGLLVSAGIRLAPSVLPNLVQETDRCVAIAHPAPQAPKHFVLFPKRDIKNIADISVEDGPFVLGCFDLLRTLIAVHKIQTYRVLSNGPETQLVTYLHWHLIGS